LTAADVRCAVPAAGIAWLPSCGRPACLVMLRGRLTTWMRLRYERLVFSRPRAWCRPSGFRCPVRGFGPDLGLPGIGSVGR